MMWFFAILLVLAMGGVAMLAAGKGTPMAEVYDDRPDANIPEPGPLGADALRRVRFSLAFRGYRMSEVDDLLDRLASEREAEGEAERAAESEAEREAQSEAGPGAGRHAERGDENEHPAPREGRGGDAGD